MEDTPDSGSSPTKRNPAVRWTKELTHKGWTPVSDFFLEHYADLIPPLTTTEAMLVIHVIKHKWDERLPRPAFATLAKRMGMSPTAVRNHARNLERHGYLKRIMRVGETNQFDFQPLFSALHALKAEIEERTKTRAKAGRDE